MRILPKSRSRWSPGFSRQKMQPYWSPGFSPRRVGVQALTCINGITRMSLTSLILRAVRLRCPRCGQARMFRGWFHMHEHCPSCDWKFERAPGYFLGSIYVNYGLTALLVVIAYFSLYFSAVLTPREILWTLAAFSVLFPIWFFRYARALWVAFDIYFDPPG